MTYAVIVSLLLVAPLATAARPRGVPAWPWYALARCEQWSPHGVRWDAYSRSYEGGYGFTHAAWRQWRYPGMPGRADRATPAQQTRVAARIQRAVGWGAWPACSTRLGLR